MVTDREVEAIDVPQDAGDGVVVHVERVLRGSEVGRGLEGEDVTVATREPDALRGYRVVIVYARVVSVGRLVLVVELGHEEATDDAVDRAARAVEVAEESPLAGRVEQADLVITGAVVSHRPLDPDADPSSEHDPDLWVALVAVDDQIKGRSEQDEVEVVYAHSTDIAWYRAPKLTPGTSGVFLLHSTGRDDAPAAVAGVSITYQCTDPLDFHPTDRVSAVRRLAGTENGED